MKEVRILTIGVSFKGGFHVHGFKELSNKSEIIEVEAPEVVKIPLLQHIGAPADSLVKKGDLVKVGQKIGELSGFISSSVHSSVSGEVLKVEETITERGRRVNTVFIQNDGKYELGYEPVDRKLEDISSKEIVHIIKEAGITGLGGASFPTHIKMSPAEDKKIDTVIINAAECEPYLTADDMLMRTKPEQVIGGLKLAMKAVKAEKGYITIEDNKPEAIESMKNAIDSDAIEVVVAKTKYPQGDEKRIIDVTVNRQVPSGGLPADVGVIVTNAATSNAIYEAVYFNKPLYERIVTFTGQAMNKPTNALIKIGTPIDYAVEQVGGFKENIGKLVLGGPMMGVAQYEVGVPLEKANNGVLAMTIEEAKFDEPSPCIKCARCVDVCPVGLMPFKLEAIVNKTSADMAKENNIMDCIECGSCSYICPAKRPLVETIRIGKNEVRKLKVK